MTTYQNALVLGLGVSGEAAARLLIENGTSVVVADRENAAALESRANTLRRAGAHVVLGEERVPPGDYDVCVVSPGLPVHTGWVAQVARRGIPVISELELAYQCCSSPVIGITGTNGKSTLTRLCGDLLTAAGCRCAIGGNYGTPACATVHAMPDAEWLVWEVSSFQLETCCTFAPRVGVILNIQPDHLDRHGSMERYAELKISMLARMGDAGVGVVPLTEHGPLARGGAHGSRWTTFGLDDRAAYLYRDGRLIHDGAIIAVHDTCFDNPITGQTAAAAWAVADACGIAHIHVQAALSHFRSLPHRMQEVSRHKGVTYIDDSKATNLSALSAGVQMARGAVRLIAGGRPKGEDFTIVKEVLAKHVQSVYLVGEAAPAMQTAWSDVVACRMCGTVEAAVKNAALDAQSGEWVLLSPGCASFDQYPDYEARGDDFAELVKQLET